jgi:hypothetical protein
MPKMNTRLGVLIRSRLAMAVAASAVVATVVTGAMAFASIPGSTGVINGCYKSGTGTTHALTVIDSAASCPSGYTSLNWNQTGPKGPRGPRGP